MLYISEERFLQLKFTAILYEDASHHFMWKMWNISYIQLTNKCHLTVSSCGYGHKKDWFLSPINPLEITGVYNPRLPGVDTVVLRQWLNSVKKVKHKVAKRGLSEANPLSGTWSWCQCHRDRFRQNAVNVSIRVRTIVPSYYHIVR